jgi:molybdopterin molybdotransferase
MNPFHDVRMRGFQSRTPVDVVLDVLAARTRPLQPEDVPVREAAGRLLARPVVAAADVPSFERAAMDGFAVRSADVAGATSDIAVSLALAGESLPARPFTGTVEAGQAVRIMTGAPFPAGADAVVVAEAAREEGDRVLIHTAVPAGKHVARVGEDVAKGLELLFAGRRLRPQDVGLIAAVGVGTVPVVRRPRVALLATGDELLPPGSMPAGYRIVDSNSPMLAALVARDGGVCESVRYVPDRYDAVRAAIQETDADVILVSGGSSVGSEDHAPRAVAELGELLVHGVAIKPAGPMGVGDVNGRTVFLLPGNPVSCLCAYDLFAGRVVRKLGGREWELPYRTLTLPLMGNIQSAVGRVDYVRVVIAFEMVDSVAARGSSILSSTVAADGFVLVPAKREALSAGEAVEVWLYD